MARFQRDDAAWTGSATSRSAIIARTADCKLWPCVQALALSSCQRAANMVDVGCFFNHGRRRSMPSLFRFLAVVGIIIGLVYGGMIALAVLVQPQQREITVTIPPDRFAKPR